MTPPRTPLGNSTRGGSGGSDSGRSAALELGEVDLGTECVGCPVVEDPPVFTSISAGNLTSCGVTVDGHGLCWGAVSAEVDDVLDIDAGLGTVCAVMSSGGVSCWGDDTHGTASPPERLGFTQLSVGLFHACAVGSGSVSCWGSGSYGETDTSGVPDELEPASVSAGSHVTCVAGEQGLHCFGFDHWGQVSDLDASMTDATVGESHTCAWGAFGGDCAGKNDNGQTDEAFGWAYPFRSVSAGGEFTCGVLAEGTILCWGADERGQLDAPSGDAWVQVAAGRYHACALDEAGAVSCWGIQDGSSDDFGQVSSAP